MQMGGEVQLPIDHFTFALFGYLRANLVIFFEKRGFFMWMIARKWKKRPFFLCKPKKNDNFVADFQIR